MGIPSLEKGHAIGQATIEIDNKRTGNDAVDV